MKNYNYIVVDIIYLIAEYVINFIARTYTIINKIYFYIC